MLRFSVESEDHHEGPRSKVIVTSSSSFQDFWRMSITPATWGSHGALSLEHSETLKVEIFLRMLLTLRLLINDLNKPLPLAT